ncbi:MAG: response regulator transcription factor [Chloroflexota bacterium]|jgi:DNA-binding NarL/FixJ family response regulator
MTIRLLLVDDQALFREGLRILLSVHGDLEVAGEAANGKEAVELTAELKPDVILMDLRMPVLDGVEATRLVRQEHPQTAVIVLTTFDDDENVFEALRAGAAGYLLKDVSSEKLVEAIRAAAQGESFLQPSVAAKVIAEFTRISGQPIRPEAQPLLEPLSERELEILAIMATGATNREIAGQLYIAEGTVKNHVTNILGKLDARDRTQAVIKAQELGIL